jgi:sporulation protein YlmC with PRC-barrel domain
MKKQLIIGMTTAALLGGTALAQTSQPADKSGMSKTPAAQTQTNMTDTTKSGTTDTKSNMTQSGTSTASTTGAANANDMTKGFAMAASASAPVKYGQVSNGDLMSSKLIGVDVYNNEKEKIGEIKDLVIDNGEGLTGVVVSVGGFLGMGESYVLIKPASIALNKQDNEWRAVVNTNKDSLKSAPKFTYDGKKS